MLSKTALKATNSIELSFVDAEAGGDLLQLRLYRLGAVCRCCSHHSGDAIPDLSHEQNKTNKKMLTRRTCRAASPQQERSSATVCKSQSIVIGMSISVVDLQWRAKPAKRSPCPNKKKRHQKHQAISQASRQPNRRDKKHRVLLLHEANR